MSESKILVTGATGDTGKASVKFLREQGHAVRAMVRTHDDRSEALQKQGAEIVLGDLRNFESVRAALEGIQSAYFVFPIEPGILEGTAYFAQAAKEAGVQAIVNMSQASARREAKSHAAQNHWIAERIFDWSGVPIVHVRPTLFSEWVLYWRGFIKAAGILPLPFHTGRVALVAAEDQGRVIANILVAPAEHIGKTYPLVGAKEFTFPEIAEEIGRAIGKPVRYQLTDVPTLAKLAKENGIPLGDFFWQHLSEIAVDFENNVFAGTNDLVQKIGGQPSISLADFIAKHRDQFAD
ncbi:NmrA family NAD(P)-binding protein [Granulicella sp. S190]|uniref:NmrA family NAD(P)-binding protein n=1 Tax=Granulicella sp. S190 TaxID=1747226 RepID=UPI00131B5BB5|nr:NmrA family NAD(P)-binding protein [Granulicella sp. S190]